MEICEGKNKKYIVDEKKVKQVENILKMLVMPKGLKAGKSLYECTVRLSMAFLYCNTLCSTQR